MCRYLVLLGYGIGRKRVRRLMRLMGFMAIYQKPKTSVPNPEHKRYPLPVARPDHKPEQRGLVLGYNVHPYA